MIAWLDFVRLLPRAEVQLTDPLTEVIDRLVQRCAVAQPTRKNTEGQASGGRPQAWR